MMFEFFTSSNFIIHLLKTLIYAKLQNGIFKFSFSGLNRLKSCLHLLYQIKTFKHAQNHQNATILPFHATHQSFKFRIYIVLLLFNDYFRYFLRLSIHVLILRTLSDQICLRVNWFYLTIYHLGNIFSIY